MKQMHKALILFVFICLNSFAQEKIVVYQADAGCTPENKTIDISHMKADLRIDPYDTLVEGEVEFTFRFINASADSVVFWAPDIEFSDVSIPGQKINYSKSGDNLVVHNLESINYVKDDDYIIKMKYTSRPKYDLFFIGWNEPAVRDNKQIWAHRPFHWLPYYSDRLTTDMRITFDGNYKVMTNGVRESVKDNADGTKTWNYRMHKEHPFFSTCLVIGDYKFLEDKTKDGLPLELWYYSNQEDHAEPTYRYTPMMFDFFSQEFGMAYPYELYREAPVEDYLYGAMETTTSTVFGDYLAVDERGWDGRNYVNVNAHELAHQWFGNCLSHLRPCDVWLTESFATYYAKLFEKQVFGDDYYQWVRIQEFDETLEASKKDRYAVGHSGGGRARWYPKGSLVLDMMRDVLGDEAFKDAVSHYATKNAFSEVETAEFRAAVYEATGKSLDWFFDEWIMRGGEPHYQVSWAAEKTMDDNIATVVYVKQAHQRDNLTGLFKMPVTFEVYYDDNSFDRKIQWIQEEYSEVRIQNPLNKKVSFVLFDPGRRILKTVSFPKSAKELSDQVLRAPLMTDRYDALVSMRNLGIDLKEKTLLEAWNKETFHLTRTEILKQLFAGQSARAEEIYSQAIQDQDPLVRRAALENIGKVPDNAKDETEKLLSDISYIVVEKALDVLCRSFPQDITRYLEATKNETGWRGRNIRMKWLEIALQAEQREYTREISDYAGPQYEFETRINAFYLLKRLNYLDKRGAAFLVNGCLYWNYKVSNAAKEVLGYFYQQNRYKTLVNSVLYDGLLPDTQVKKIKEILGSIK
ncbi:MAG: M1 family metallopeptidase [Bacteroidales bacterium]|jgi:aminopeptidase N|nr:M1 family metallopeptidase [Bacteroidales bacterium]